MRKVKFKCGCEVDVLLSTVYPCLVHDGQSQAIDVHYLNSFVQWKYGKSDEVLIDEPIEEFLLEV